MACLPTSSERPQPDPEAAMLLSHPPGTRDRPVEDNPEAGHCPVLCQVDKVRGQAETGGHGLALHAAADRGHAVHSTANLKRSG